jgi:hypothetical protein
LRDKCFASAMASAAEEEAAMELLEAACARMWARAQWLT